MGKRSISGGVIAAGNRIMFDLHIDGQRFRPTLPWMPSELSLQRARERMIIFKAQIAAGTFSFAESFPDYRGRKRLNVPSRTFTCSEVIDAFIEHSEARVARNDLAPSTVTSYCKILNHTWRPRLGRMPFLRVRYSTLTKIADAHRCSKKTYNNVVSAIKRVFEFSYCDHPEQRNPAAFLKCARIRRSDRPAIDPFTIAEAENFIAALHREWGEAQGNFDEFRFFTGLRPSEQIALLVSDFDAVRSILHVTKARVLHIDREVTKTGEARHIALCPRALLVLARQSRLRERLTHEGRIDHEYLFFDRNGQRLRDTKSTYRHWRDTLKRLPIRYRKPYVARHCSVSWNLMIGRNPVRVAQQHGHSQVTMLTVYTAWAHDTFDDDVSAIHRAMYSPDVAAAETRADLLDATTPRAETDVNAQPHARASSPPAGSPPSLPRCRTRHRPKTSSLSRRFERSSAAT